MATKAPATLSCEAKAGQPPDLKPCTAGRGEGREELLFRKASQRLFTCFFPSHGSKGREGELPFPSIEKLIPLAFQEKVYVVVGQVGGALKTFQTSELLVMPS